MPKITRHAGVTDKTREPGPRTPADVLRERGKLGPYNTGEEESSPGNSSQTSPEKPPNSPEPNETPRPKPARTTGSRSPKARADSSIAASTATSGTAAPDEVQGA